MANVGGVNITFGADLSNLDAASKGVKSYIDKIEKQFQDIRLENIIKGDPFSSTRDYFKIAKTEINNVFASWSQNITGVEENMGKWAVKVKALSNTIALSYNSILDKMDTANKLQKEIAKIDSKKLRENPLKMGGQKFSTIGQMNKFINEYKVEKDAGGKQKLGSKVEAELSKFGEQLKSAYESYRKLSAEEKKDTSNQKYKEKLETIKSLAGFEERRTQIVRQLTLEEEKYASNIKNNFNVEESRAKLLKVLEAKRAAGTFGGVQKARMEKYSKEDDLYNESKASSVDAALKRRSDRLKELGLEEKRLRVEMSQGMYVDKNKRALLKNLEERIAAGIKLTPELTAEVTKLRKEFEKPIKKDAFMSKKWLMERAVWFIQLRGFWILWRGLMDSMKEAFAFDQEMASVQAITQAATKSFEELRVKALEVGATTMFSAKEAASGMITLAQAGLSAKEILASIQDVAELATATMYDFKGTAELVTTVMRSWGYEAKDTKEIVDILASSINSSRLTMDGLVTSMNYVSGIASEVNLSLAETTAILGTFSNRGLNASVAATSLRGLLAELLKPTDRFRRVLEKTGVDLTKVDVSIYSVSEILNTLKDAGWTAEHAFRAFDRRVANGAAIAIQSADSLDELASKMNQVDRAAIMSAQNLFVVSAQWKQFKDITIAVAADVTNNLKTFFLSVIEIFSGMIKLIGYVVGPITRAFGSVMDAMYNFARGQDKLITDLVDIQNQFREYQNELDGIIGKYRKVRDEEVRLQKLFRQAKKPHLDTQDVIATYRKAINMAKQSKLISDEESKTLVNMATTQDGRWKIEKQLTGAVSERVIKLEEEYTKVKEIQKTQAEFKLAEKMPEINEALEKYNKSKKEIDVLSATRIKTMGREGDISTNIGDTVNDLNAMIELLKTKNEKDVLVLGRLLNTLDENMLEVIKDTWLWTDGGLKEAYEYSKKINEELVKGKKIVGGLHGEYSLSGAAGSELKKKGGKASDTAKELKDEVEKKADAEKKKKEMEIELRILKREKVALQKKQQDAAITGNIRDISKEISVIDTKILNKESAIAKIEEDIGVKQLRIAHYKDLVEETSASILEKIRKEAIIQAEVNKAIEDRNNKLKTSQEVQQRITTLSNGTVDSIDLEIELAKSRGTSEKELLYLEMKRHDALTSITRTMLEMDKAAKGTFLTDEQRLSLQTELNKKQTESVGLVNKYKQIHINDINMAASEELSILNRKLKHKEIEVASELELLKIQKKQSDVILNRIFKTMQKINLDEKERKQLALEYNEEMLKGADLDEKILRQEDLSYDIWKHIVEKSKSFREMLHDIGKLLVDELAAGFANVMQDLTGGFQEQQQEVENLKGEVNELKQEAGELSAKGLLTDEEAKRFREITSEVDKLNQEINDLEDPIHNTAEAMKDAAKDMVDAIRKVINEWIAMQIVMGLAKVVGIGAGGIGSNASFQFGGPGSPWLAHGGVISNIKAFRAFSKGGMTSNPTMAILGDNPSGKELVIPSENISSNNVSGYTRDSGQAITIVNVISQDDVAAAMAGKAGERVILNTIGKDMRNRGVTSRTVRA